MRGTWFKRSCVLIALDSSHQLRGHDLGSFLVAPIFPGPREVPPTARQGDRRKNGLIEIVVFGGGVVQIPA